MVLSAGDAPAVGLIASGAVQVIAEDPMGNRTIIGRMEAGTSSARRSPARARRACPFQWRRRPTATCY